MNTVAIMGALAGLLVGYGMFELINQIARRARNEQTRRVLRFAGMVDVFVFPVVGFFVAPLMFGGA